MKMIEINLTQSEFDSLIESATEDYYIVAVWTGKPYIKNPKDCEGTARILSLKSRKDENEY